MGDSSCKKSLILYYPHIEQLIVEMENKGCERGDLLKWLGYVLSEMLALPFQERWMCKSVGEKLDNILRSYHNVIYLNSYPFMRDMNVTEIIQVRYLGGGSVVIVLR